MGGDSYIKGCWFKYQQHILDGLFSHLFLVKIVIFVWRGPKINENRPGMARLKKRCNLLLIYCSHRLLACLPPAESLFLPQRWFKAQRRRKKILFDPNRKRKMLERDTCLFPETETPKDRNLFQFSHNRPWRRKIYAQNSPSNSLSLFLSLSLSHTSSMVAFCRRNIPTGLPIQQKLGYVDSPNFALEHWRLFLPLLRGRPIK